LVAHWPRTQLADATNSFWHEQVAIVLALIGGAGVVIIVLVDRLIVRRLKRLRDQLAQVVNHAEFQGEVALAGNDEIAELARMIRRLLEALRTHTQELRNLSQTDSLTGLANRRRFQERLAHLLEQAMRQPKALALILVDVDHFKPYNDHHGHPAGDLALQRVAQCLQHTARRATDLVARLGGEEFALVLDNADPARALQLAEAVRNAVQALQIAHADQPHGQYLTISCGVALSRTGDTLQALYQRADQALYTAKETGRNRVAEFGLG
jgi:diguanylate cyclase (GGDEF)-like protein